MTPEKISWIGLPLVLALLATDVGAVWPQTDADYALLPPYCNARMRHKDGPEDSSWARRIGEGYGHIHHYCAALHSENVANQTRDETKKLYLLWEALNEMAYVEKHSGTQFKLMPELLVKKGKILERRKNPVEAMEAYRQAIKLNPQYGWAHKGLADLYVTLGKPDDARRILEEGKAGASPENAKWFQKQIDDLPVAPAATVGNERKSAEKAP